MTSWKCGLAAKYCSKWQQRCSNFGLLWRWIPQGKSAIKRLKHQWVAKLSARFSVALSKNIQFLEWPPLKTQQSTVIWDLCLRKTGPWKSQILSLHHLWNLHFQNVFHPHVNEKPHFCDGLLWMVGITVEIKLHFQIPLAQCGHCLIQTICKFEEYYKHLSRYILIFLGRYSTVTVFNSQEWSKCNFSLQYQMSTFWSRLVIGIQSNPY